MMKTYYHANRLILLMVLVSYRFRGALRDRGERAA